MGTSMFRITERMLKVQEFAIWLRLCLSPPPREQLAFWLFHHGGGAALPGAGAVCGGCHGGAAALRSHRPVRQQACWDIGPAGTWPCWHVAMLGCGFPACTMPGCCWWGLPHPHKLHFQGVQKTFLAVHSLVWARSFFFFCLSGCVCAGLFLPVVRLHPRNVLGPLLRAQRPLLGGNGRRCSLRGGQTQGAPSSCAATREKQCCREHHPYITVGPGLSGWSCAMSCKAVLWAVKLCYGLVPAPQLRLLSTCVLRDTGAPTLATQRWGEKEPVAKRTVTMAWSSLKFVAGSSLGPSWGPYPVDLHYMTA